MAALPEVVDRYLRRALVGARALSLERRYSQNGELRTGPRSRRWMPFTATHRARTDRPEFQWEARVRAFPLVTLRVSDALAAGMGSGRVQLGPLPLGGDAGTTQMHSGALHRYLAEAVWYPAALSAGRVQWSAIDERRALARLTDADVEVSLEFRFDAAGDVEAIHTPARWGKFEGGYRQREWEGHFFDYGLRDGERIPARGEVGWYDEGRWQAVWRGRVEPVCG